MHCRERNRSALLIGLNPCNSRSKSRICPFFYFLPRSLFPGFRLYSSMSKSVGASFSRRMPDNVAEELVAVLSSRASFEFKPLFDIILLNRRERNAASGGEEVLRLRVYEKLQGLVGQGPVNRTVTGTMKKYKGVAPRLNTLRAEMKLLRAEWSKKLRAKALAKS